MATTPWKSPPWAIVVLLGCAGLASCSSFPGGGDDDGVGTCRGKRRPINVNGSVLPGGPAPVRAGEKPPAVQARPAQTPGEQNKSTTGYRVIGPRSSLSTPLVASC